MLQKTRDYETFQPFRKTMGSIDYGSEKVFDCTDKMEHGANPDSRVDVVTILVESGGAS